MVSLIFKAIRNHIFKSAINGIWKAKNNHDQIALKNSWIKNKFLVSAYVLKAEMDIKIYKIGQTIPNTYPGGFKLDLLSSKYHKSLAVSDDERPPSNKANITKGNTEYLLFKNKLSFSKKPRNSSWDIFEECGAFWSSFYKNIETYKDCTK